MASCMTKSYRPQIAQMNEKSLQESSLDLTLMQHPRDENRELRKVRPHLKVEPLELGIIAFLQTPAP